jgi:hypothetical protein
MVPSSFPVTREGGLTPGAEPTALRFGRIGYAGTASKASMDASHHFSKAGETACRCRRAVNRVSDVIQHILRILHRCALSASERRRHAMPTRFRQSTGGGRPTSSWLAGIMIGWTVTTLAAGAMMFGAGMAVGQAMIKPK